MGDHTMGGSHDISRTWYYIITGNILATMKAYF